MSNGPARELKIDSSLQECGELISDPYELSRIRREGKLFFMKTCLLLSAVV